VLASILAFVFSFSYECHHPEDSLKSEVVIKGRAQGTTYLIRYFPGKQILPKSNFDSILAEIDRSLSLYRQDSYISRLNQFRKKGLADIHLSRVLSTGLQIQEISEGIFDVRLLPLLQAWGFGPNPSNKPPSQKKISRLRPSTNDRIWFDAGYIRKSRPKLKIDLDGLAQGYSVDILCDYLYQQGISNFMVELGGEIRASGRKSNIDDWKVGIESPEDLESTSELIVSLKNQAITTSGSYRKTKSFRGKVYSHIIDPRTGKPLQNNMISCTVVAPTAILADALDNIGMILGPVESLPLFSKFENIAAHFVWVNSEGRIQRLSTPAFAAMTAARQ
jgi:thiamine biosynthesis lipoprotein